MFNTETQWREWILSGRLIALAILSGSQFKLITLSSYIRKVHSNLLLLVGNAEGTTMSKFSLTLVDFSWTIGDFRCRASMNTEDVSRRCRRWMQTIDSGDKLMDSVDKFVWWIWMIVVSDRPARWLQLRPLIWLVVWQMTRCDSRWLFYEMVLWVPRDDSMRWLYEMTLWDDSMRWLYDLADFQRTSLSSDHRLQHY